MPASQLTAACWVAYPAQRDLLHWDSEALASDRVARLYPGGAVTAVPLPAPCWMLRCDGPACGYWFEDPDDGSCHGTTRAESEAAATRADWVITIGGLAYCPPCIPECDQTDLVIVAECAGLLTVQGVR